MTDYCPRRQSFICTPATLSSKAGQKNIEDWLMSLRQGSPANRSQLEDCKEECTTAETAGLTPFALLERSALSGSFWRTLQTCFRFNTEEELHPTFNRSLETWPQSGMMRNGAAYQLPPWEPTTSGNGCGLLPTPVARDGKSFYVVTNATAQRIMRNKPLRQLHWMQYGVVYHALKKGWANPRFSEMMMGWPIGWTDLKPLETDKFQQWLRKLGGC